MVISHLSGGFGNQLFSYAFAYAVAKARNEELWIDTSIQDADWFFRNPDILKLNITFDKRLSYKIGRSKISKVLNRIRFRHSIGWTTTVINEGDIESVDEWFDTCVKTKGNIYIKGNWSCEGQFITAKEDIINRYVFKEELSEGARKISEEIQACNNTVGIHYRLGDYVKIGIVPKAEFFIDAMKSMAERYDNPIFFCFSEDVEWVKKQFNGLPYDIRYPDYVSEDKGIEDFRLFSLCENQILSNSSYSWWGAYLNKNSNKYVIAPTDYDGGWSTKLYPVGWDLRPFDFIR